MRSIHSFLVLALVLSSGYGFCQNGYEQVAEHGKVTFYGKWKPSKCLKKDSPLKLCLMIHNTNDHAVDCSFSLAFFDTGIVAENSEKITVCISPNKKVQGHKKGLCLLSADLTNEQITAKSFGWAVDDPVITKTDRCKK